jgi:nicotinamide mononucleotide transporter
MKKTAGYTLAALGSVALILYSWFYPEVMTESEVFGFLTGALSVWLTVKVNIWNWPVGIANSAFYLIVFFTAALYADAALQVVYIILGFLGWYWWLHGGNNRSQLPITRTRPLHALILLALLAAFTYAETVFLVRINDSAPFWDALTTALSLVAQYMLTRKLLENWFVWITADVIYIALYLYKSLYLTSILYLIFMLMCVAGARQWLRAAREQQQAPVPELVATGGGGQ